MRIVLDLSFVTNKLQSRTPARSRPFLRGHIRIKEVSSSSVRKKGVGLTQTPWSFPLECHEKTAILASDIDHPQTFVPKCIVKRVIPDINRGSLLSSPVCSGDWTPPYHIKLRVVRLGSMDVSSLNPETAQPIHIFTKKQVTNFITKYLTDTSLHDHMRSI